MKSIRWEAMKSLVRGFSPTSVGIERLMPPRLKKRARDGVACRLSGSLSGAFGSDKLVDAGTQIVQLKVLIRRRLAVVDFLRPLLKRHLDPERFVDCKGNIEKIQAVNAEVVNGVALRVDRLARNIQVSEMMLATVSKVEDIGKSLIGHAGRQPR